MILRLFSFFRCYSATPPTSYSLFTILQSDWVAYFPTEPTTAYNTPYITTLTLILGITLGLLEP